MRKVIVTFLVPDHVEADFGETQVSSLLRDAIYEFRNRSGGTTLARENAEQYVDERYGNRVDFTPAARARQIAYVEKRNVVARAFASAGIQVEVIEDDGSDCNAG